jgi:hypothetical protein
MACPATTSKTALTGHFIFHPPAAAAARGSIVDAASIAKGGRRYDEPRERHEGRPMIHGSIRQLCQRIATIAAGATLVAG